MHYHYIPQMPGDGRQAYCEDHCPQSDLQDGMVYTCDCENNACVVCEENAPEICFYCKTPVLLLDSRITTPTWSPHFECVVEYGRRYGKQVENPPT